LYVDNREATPSENIGCPFPSALYDAGFKKLSVVESISVISVFPNPENTGWSLPESSPIPK
jgi:hypothetical protein